MNDLSSSSSAPWYANGLTFGCARCGHCCTFPGGYVWLSMDEISELARHCGMSIQSFGQKYLRKIGPRYSLIEKSNGECVFYGSGGCQVYAVRPLQCRTFPFWPENMRSAQTWQEVGKTCRGWNKGFHWSQEQIEEQLQAQRKHDQEN